MPVIPRSFHYWQPAPRRRPLPWLGNPGNPAMSPHAAGKKAGTRHTENFSGKGGGKGEGRNRYKLSYNVCETPTLQSMLKSTKCTRPLRCMLVPEHDGSWYMRILQTPLASGMEQALLVVNSVKLHLTA